MKRAKGYIKLISLILLLFVVNCSKSAEQRILDKEKADKLLVDADKLYNISQFKSALEYYKQIEALDINDSQLYYKIAFCYDKGDNDLKSAKEYYLKALDNAKIQNNLKLLSAAYFNLGIIASKENNESEKYENMKTAFSLLEKMLQLNDMDGEDIFRLAYCYMEKKDVARSRKLYSQAINYFKEKNPAHIYYAGAYFNIGITYWQNNDINTALYYWRRALTIEPKNELYLTWVKKAKETKDIFNY